MTEFGALGLAGSGVAINVITKVRAGEDWWPTLLYGFIFSALVVVLAAWRPRAGGALAAVFVLASVLRNGPALFTWVQQLPTTTPKGSTP